FTVRVPAPGWAPGRGVRPGRLNRRLVGDAATAGRDARSRRYELTDTPPSRSPRHRTGPRTPSSVRSGSHIRPAEAREDATPWTISQAHSTNWAMPNPVRL